MGGPAENPSCLKPSYPLTANLGIKAFRLARKSPLQPKHVWSIRARLELSDSARDLALFNLAIDSKLRACDLVSLRVNDLCQAGKIRDRATVIQQKTGKPVRFETTDHTRLSIERLLAQLPASGSGYLFEGRSKQRPHISTRQYARIVHTWVESIGLETTMYGTHTMRRTKASQLYRKTGNLRAVQLLLGHTKLESTVRYLGIEVDDALEMAEQIDL